MVVAPTADMARQKQELILAMTDGHAEYLRDESRSVGRGESISFPTCEEDVICIMQEMHRLETSVTVQGGRTGLAAGAVPYGGHIMNMLRMNGVTGLRQDDDGCFYIRVQPGMALSRMRKLLENKRFANAGFDAASQQAFAAFREAPEQFFPTDPTESSATIGGIVACNASGARSYLYGPARPYIQGVRLVLCDGLTLALQRGEVLATGRLLELTTEQGSHIQVPLPAYSMPKVKNASGYYAADDMDAIDLFIGSDGTLGIITEIELKLLPLPSIIWGVSCFVEQNEQAIDLVIKVRQQMTQVASMEYFNADAFAVLRRQKQLSSVFAQLPDIPARYAAAIYFELHCESETTALACLDTLSSLMVQVGADPENTWVARTAADLDRLHFLRHAAPESVNMLIDARKKEDPIITKLGTDMSVPDQHLHFIMKTYREMLAERDLQSALWGHIGDNHVHVNILPRDAADYYRGKELYTEWSKLVTSLGGAVSAEHGVGKLKAEYLVIMYGEENVADMAATKAALDPLALLGVGNLFSVDLVHHAAALQADHSGEDRL